MIGDEFYAAVVVFGKMVIAVVRTPTAEERPFEFMVFFSFVWMCPVSDRAMSEDLDTFVLSLLFIDDVIPLLR